MRISDWSSDVCSSDLTNRPSALPAFSEISKRRTYHLHRGSNHRSHIGKARDDVGQCAACPGQVALTLSAEQFRDRRAGDTSRLWRSWPSCSLCRPWADKSHGPCCVRERKPDDCDPPAVRHIGKP